MLTLKNTKPINYYKSLDKLKILTFWKIIQDKNILLLDFDYFYGKEYTKEQKEEIEQTWLKLYDEYYILVNDSKSKYNLDKSFEELRLRDKINQVKQNYDFLIVLNDNKLRLKPEDIQKYEQETYRNLVRIDKRIKPLFFKGIEANLKNLDRVLKSLINRYNTDNKNNKKEVEKQIQNVYDVVANAESWLERNLDIDNMVVSRWIAYEKQIKDKQKAQKKNGK